MPEAAVEVQVKILKAHMGLKKDEITKMDEADAQALISKGIAEEIKVTPETIEAAIGEVVTRFDAKLTAFGSELTSQLEDRFAKGLKKIRPRMGGNEIIVGEDGRMNDPTGGFRGLHEFAKCVRNAAMGQEDDRLALIRKAAAGASEGIAADGGYATPVQYANNIYNDIIGQDSLFNLCMKIPMNGPSIKLPALNYTTQGSFGVTANWEGEAVTIPTSKPAYRQPSLTLNKLTCLVPVTSELLEDGIAIEPVIQSLASEAMTYKINDAIINGDGVGKPVGIVGHGSTVSVASQAATTSYLTTANVLNMEAALYGNRQRAVWLINQDVKSSLLTVADSGGRFLYFAPGSMPNNPDAQLLGIKVVPSINCQTKGTVGDIILWDPYSYWVGYKSTGPQQAISIHLYFNTDQTAYRWTFRLDGRPTRDTTLAAAHGSATYGGAVTLATRS